MGGNLTGSEAAAITVASVSISQDDGQAMMAAAAQGGAHVTAWLRRQTLDPGDALMWVIAVATVIAAGHWAGYDYVQQLQGSAREVRGHFLAI
jgi:hypothetical protein